MNGTGRNLVRSGAVLAVLAGAGSLIVATLPAYATQVGSTGCANQTVTPWRAVRHISPPRGDVFMVGVSPVRPADAWALGQVIYPQTAKPLIEHWNGTQWSQVALPARVRRQFNDTDFWDAFGASSGGNVWAFALNGHYLRLQGTRWTAGFLPNPGTGAVEVESVKVFSRTDVWAFGARVNGTKVRPYAARFNGSTWTEVPVPGRLDISAVSAVSAHDMFAVTGVIASAIGPAIRPHVLKWDGTRWRALAVQPRLRAGAVIYTIAAQSNAGIWIGGSTAPAMKQTLNLVKHWNGRTWLSATPSSTRPAGSQAVVSLVPDGCRGIWGLAANLSSAGLERIWRHGANGWSGPTRVPWTLTTLAAIRGTTSAWAVGQVKVNGRFHGVIVLHGTVPGRRDTVGKS